jgi:hypothetical protein
MMKITAVRLSLLAGCLLFAGARHALAQEKAAWTNAQENTPSIAEVVALDECDPTTFNAALRPDFCKNITLGAFTTLSELCAKAAARTPDPG